MGLAIGLLGCATEAAPDPRAADPSWRGERIQVLRRAIAEDHATLEDLITRPPQPESATQLHHDPELKAIAERLSDHKRELARLEALALSMPQNTMPQSTMPQRMTQKARR
jgi:hypothetical protein